MHTTPHQKSVPDVPRGTRELQKGCGQLANRKTFPGAKKTLNKSGFQSLKICSSPFSSWFKSWSKVWMLPLIFLLGNPWIQGRRDWGTTCDIPMGYGFVAIWVKNSAEVSVIFPCSSVRTLQSSSLCVTLRVSLLQPLLIVVSLGGVSPNRLFYLLLCFRFYSLSFLSLTWAREI